MTHKLRILSIALLTCLATGLCVRLASTSLPASQRPAGREIVDATGRAVRVPDVPRRVLSLCTSATDTIVRLGAADRLAAIDDYGRIVVGTGSALVVGKAGALPREQIIAEQIDLAFIWWYQDAAAATLQELGVPVVRVRSGRASEVPAMIRLVGEAMGETAAADKLADEVWGYLAKARGQAGPGRDVYIELYGPYRTAGSDTYANDLLELAGAGNVAAGASGNVLLSAEQLIQADPDVILFVDEFSSVEAISARSPLAGCPAVRSGRVRPIQRYWLVAGAGLPEAVESLRRAIEMPGDR